MVLWRIFNDRLDLSNIMKIQHGLTFSMFKEMNCGLEFTYKSLAIYINLVTIITFESVPVLYRP